MKNKKKNQQKTNQKDILKNTIFILAIIIALLIIIVLSFGLNNNKEVALPFSSSDFKNISTIGIKEFQASLNVDDVSIIFFCNNETKACYDELKELDTIAKEHNLLIEYINVLELVESEKEELSATANIFNEEYYPHLIIIKNKNILSNSDEYLTGSEIEKILKEHEII